MRGQRRIRHDHDERFAKLTQAREDSGKLTEGRVGHHALTKVAHKKILINGKSAARMFASPPNLSGLIVQSLRFNFCTVDQVIVASCRKP
mgnify:CR=1 FL=1